MEKKEQLHHDDGSSDLPASRTTGAQLPQEQNGNQYFFVADDEMFNYMPFDNDNIGGFNIAAKNDEYCSQVTIPLPTLNPCQLIPQPFSNNSPPNNPYSDQLTCRSSPLPADVSKPLLEHVTEDPETDWLKFLELEPDSNEELQKQQQQVVNWEITATPSLQQATHHQVDYPFSAAAGVDTTETPPPFAAIATQLSTEVTPPEKAAITRKRDHNTACAWSPHLDPIAESPSLVQSDTGIMNPNPVKPPAKKKRETSPDGVARRCQHCSTDKTPQWRAGPMGPKSLCNACGVRYKSGRLMPEYRPASSPTFAVSQHSNSHRKVCEIRRQKGLPTEPHPSVNEGAINGGKGRGCRAAPTQVTNPGHDFFIYQHHQNQHLYLSDILQNCRISDVGYDLL